MDNNRLDDRLAKGNGSKVWPYVIVGSAIGGAVGYFFMTESGKKVRHSITHPDELANNLDGARSFMEEKTRMVTDRVHGIINKARKGIEEGQRAYEQAGQEFRSRANRFENRGNEITSDVHTTVDKMSRTAVSVEQSVLDPICEMGALYKGIERGVKVLLGKASQAPQVAQIEPIPIQRDRVMG